MSEKLLAGTGFFEDLSGVDGDGLGEGEVGFEGEGRWWEEGWRGQVSAAGCSEDLSGVDGDGLGEGEDAEEEECLR